MQNLSSNLKFNIVASWTMMILCGISLFLDLGSLGFVLIAGFLTLRSPLNRYNERSRMLDRYLAFLAVASLTGFFLIRTYDLKLTRENWVVVTSIILPPIFVIGILQDVRTWKRLSV